MKDTHPLLKPVRLFCLLLLILIPFAVFWQVRHFAFLSHDDMFHISENPYLKNGFSWHQFQWIWTVDLTFDSFYADYWHPVTLLSHLLDMQLFGAQAGAHHLMNLAYHLMNVFLLFGLFYRITGAFWRSYLMTLIFAIHPLQTESIAWVSARKDLLSAFFVFLSLHIYVSEFKQNQSLKKILLVFCFALALMSKLAVAILPLAIFVFDYWPLKRLDLSRFFRSLQPLIREKWFLFTLSLMAVFVIVWGASDAAGDVLNSFGGGVHPNDIPGPLFDPNVGTFASVKAHQWLVIPYAYLKHLVSFFDPSPLAFIHGPYQAHWLISLVIAPCVLITLTLMIWQTGKTKPYLITGWFWFFVMLFPASTLEYGNRFMYLPIIGLAILLVWGSFELFELFKIRLPFVITGAILLTAVGAALSWQATAKWVDSEALLNHSIQTVPNNHRAHWLITTTYISQGNFDRALTHLAQSDPNIKTDNELYYRMGLLLERYGKFNEAKTYFEKVLAINSLDANAKEHLAHCLLKLGQPEEAAQHYQALLDRGVRGYELESKLGAAQVELGQLDAAHAHLLKALASAPDDAQTLMSLGDLMKRAGQYNQAENYYRQLIKQNPRTVTAHHQLGMLFMEQAQFEEAVKHFKNVWKYGGNLSTACNNAGICYFQLGKIDEAEKSFQEALKYDARNAEAHSNLGAVYMNKKLPQKAIEHFKQALELQPDLQAAQDNLARAESAK
ncbi:MAG: hypothetical protein COV74_03680 [Candidatus Omnitrophica bacterium CG11_big_fil_rev_8_21_14_0_20_45_26]|uniref:Uncharacterized protein n=1 Tax=Candidatus Abzuiibacterium crystallinum TaxID=1974748 RepID=A0A2H0LQG8_9BACT|nr:MAG: hypothetical protein COV74_03680 [Candidatus Omnitrophica bacterium CG11_big_fil_rev_8_21_14_0_20_45_26]PIW64392.1 MAG: hypothetical protein COW12_06450 [Candidatus Omnitrophica bacterium CG12_big_fil_rev_8_21_14_0_65_45_16]